MSGRRLIIEEEHAGVEGVTRYAVVDDAGAPIPGPRVAIVGLTHGNEPVGAEALARLREVIADRLLGGEVLAVLANLAARDQGLRHTADGRDMNRLWHRAALARLAAGVPDVGRAELCYEERRVAALAPVLATADVILDLHSTSRPSRPHLVFRDDLRHAELAARLGVKLMVTGIHEGAVLEGGVTPDLGLDPGAYGDRLGFTLEAGQHTNPANVRHAWDVVVRLLHAFGMWDEVPPPPSPDFEVYEVIERFRQAPAGTPQYRFVVRTEERSEDGARPGWGALIPPAPGVPGASTAIEPIHLAPSTSRRGPQRHLESFEPVEADEAVLVRGHREVIRADSPFTMIMPAPTAKPGEDLFYFCQRRHAALAARPQTDDQACVEALAIERFLDRIGDDEAQRGQTVVSFHPRRTNDLVADLIARTTRLPPGHPHRRLIIVGRGADDGDESEVRNLRRYHQAVAGAIAAGVPIDRFQLLRGASFAWLRTLAETWATGVRLFLSARHPHTVSLILAGDPERAFAEGDFHHVRVALVIEAATIEPEGASVRTRITRAGLFGARPELVRVAQGLVASLRQDHRTLLADGTLTASAELIGPDGALCCHGEPAALTHLRALLFRSQLRTWRQALRVELPRATRLDTPDALGHWLAHVMVETGILDDGSLRRLLVRADGDGWVVDPSGLDAEPDIDAWLADAPPARAVPDQVLDAATVDRNTFDRWSGWKRFIREIQPVPGTEGRDLSLAFAAPPIRRRLRRWFDDAVERATREPGRWMLVIAGDGFAPSAQRDHLAEELAAHRRALQCAGLRYLRIQHAPGSHLPWVKGLFGELQDRPVDGARVSMCWETEHGGTLNVILLARQADDAAHEPWSLEAWAVERCAVLVRDPAADTASPHDDAIGLFTEPDEHGQVNQELLHFGRAHCAHLLAQSAWRFTFHGRPGPAVRVALERAVVDLIARWVGQVRDDAATLRALAEAGRVGHVARSLGLADPDLAAGLLRAADTPGSAQEAARRLWAEVGAWPEPPLSYGAPPVAVG